MGHIGGALEPCVHVRALGTRTRTGGHKRSRRGPHPAPWQKSRRFCTLIPEPFNFKEAMGMAIQGKKSEAN